MGQVDGKVAVVTGATLLNEGSDGLNIGGATALKLVREGGRVVIADINAEGVHALESMLNRLDLGDVARAVEVDLRDVGRLEELVNEAVATFGRLDILMNIAGIFRSDDLDVVALEQNAWEDTMAVNLRAPFLLTKHAVPRMLETGGGAIVNTASTHALAGDTTLSAYGMTKAGVIALTQFTATQFGLKGIRANAICPGPTASPPGERLPQVIKDVMARSLLGPWGSPHDQANAFVFLASDAAQFINGSVLRVDGGLMTHQPFVADLADIAMTTINS